MDPEYLTREMIAYLEQSARDPIWRMGILAAGYKNWYGILRVSPAGLIHFYGNRDTGWQHVISRHAYYSNNLYFRDGAKGCPSKFTPHGTAIFDWVRVADNIYVQGEIDTKEHPDGAQFIKYTGKSNGFTGSNGELKDFVLILYRGTRIVHSIYPKKDLLPASPKTTLKDFKRALDLISAEKQLFGDWLTIRIPYLNSSAVPPSQGLSETTLRCVCEWSGRLWQSRVNNSISSSYNARAQGRLRQALLAQKHVESLPCTMSGRGFGILPALLLRIAGPLRRPCGDGSIELKAMKHLTRSVTNCLSRVCSSLVRRLPYCMK